MRVGLKPSSELPGMRFVPIKTEEQLDLQALHRVRERWVTRRTAVVNQIRSLLLERGLTLPKAGFFLTHSLFNFLGSTYTGLGSGGESNTRIPFD